MSETDVHIVQVGGALPLERLADLLADSRADGHRALDRLINDWADGSNSFNKPGEAFFLTVRDDGAIIGAGGRNIDPYENNTMICRVRRLYVHSHWRNKGMARLLMKAILDVPPGAFTCATLHTNNPIAARLYESIGFIATGNPQTSHRMEFTT